MNFNRRTFLTLMAVAPSLLKQALAETSAKLDATNPIATYGQSVVYDIYRKKKRIGSHTVRFTTTDNTVLVDVESKIVVTVLKVPVFRFNYQSTETWINGQLQRVEAATNDNGKKHKVSAERSSDDMSHMLLTDQAGKASKEKVDYTSNHWNSDVLAAEKMFNTLTGKTNELALQTIGVESIELSNDAKTTVEATHYELTGKLKTNLWYDNAGRWVKLRFKGEDGTAIEYRCKGFIS